MKLTCTQENLNKGLSLVSRIVSSRATLPVLSNILLTTDQGQLKLSSTDLEIGINTLVGAKIENEGSITIPARLLAEYITVNNDETIDLELKDTTLSLNSQKYHANIKGIQGSEFPLIPKIKKLHSFKMKTLLLKKALSLVVFACSIDGAKPVLSGVLFNIEGNKLFLAATDSYRLAEKTIDLEEASKENIQIIVPQKTVQELYRILPEEDSILEITIGENQIQFDFNATEIISRLIEGKFPAYKEIIPQKGTTKIEVFSKELTNALKMASLFARETANNIKLKYLGKDKLQISAVSPQLGDNISILPVEGKGEELEIAFNSKFLLDFLSNIVSEKVEFQFSDKFTAGLMKPKGQNDYLYVIMPLRVEE